MKKIIEVSCQGNSEAVLSDLLYEFKDNLSAYNMTLKELHLPTDITEVTEWYKKKYPYSNGSYEKWYSSLEADARDTFEFLNQLKGGEE